MRRLLVGVVLGALAVAGIPALASHITEPTWPIEKLDMFVGHYSSGTDVGCDDGQIGTWPSEFVRLRMNGYISTVTRPGGEPTEHFEVLQFFNYPYDGTHSGNIYFADKWRHQNLKPHSPQRWQITQAEIGNVLDKPGMWRVFLQVTGDESGNVLTQECIFEVEE